MKRTYTLFQQYIAYALLISFFLQSCGGLNNPVLPIKEDVTASIHTQPIIPPNIQTLVGQELTAQGGHAITFYEEAGELKANVAMNAPQGFSKSCEGVDVAVEQGTELSSLALLNTKAQERRIHLQPAHAGKPAKIVVYKGAGLMGGMRAVKEQKKEKSEFGQKLTEDQLNQIITVFMEDKDSIPLEEKNFYLGRHFYQKRDYTNAFEWFEKAANQGFAEAQCSLGWMYENGEGIPQDGQKAVKWYKKAVEQGDKKAAYNLGVIYGIGKLIDKDATRAVRWFKEAAEKGLIEAAYNLGEMYERGDDIPMDKVEAVKWYKKAADQGYARAAYSLAHMYSCGEGTEQSYPNAIKFFEKAAEKGYEDAEYNLGVIYHHVWVTGNDYNKAVKWYKKAVEQGDKKAAYNLGVMYHIGQGVKQNYEQAKGYFVKANTPEALYAIGKLFESGKVKPTRHPKPGENYRKAYNFYLKSNIAEANLAMIGLYQKGCIQPNPNTPEQLDKEINKAIEQLNSLLRELPVKDAYYIKGIAEYYLGSYKDALFSLHQAILLGSEEEGLNELVKEIQNSLDQEDADSLLEKEIEDSRNDDLSEQIEVADEQLEEEELKKGDAVERQEAKARMNTAYVHRKSLKTKADTITSKTRKEQKRKNRVKRIKLEFLEVTKPFLKGIKSNSDPIKTKLIFENPRQEKEFEAFRCFEKQQGRTKIEELLKDIQCHKWIPIGIGQPEKLKYIYKGKYKGCLSRRITEEERLVYGVTGPGEIHILSWQGHYK